MVRWLTVQGIGTFQVLIIRGCCQAGRVQLPLKAFKSCAEALGSGGVLLGSPCSGWLGSSRLERVALLGRAVVGYGGVCGLAPRGSVAWHRGFGFLAIALMPLADSQILGQTAPIFSAAFARLFLKDSTSRGPGAMRQEEWHCSEFLSALAAVVGVAFISDSHTPPGFLRASKKARREAASPVGATLAGHPLRLALSPLSRRCLCDYPLPGHCKGEREELRLDLARLKRCIGPRCCWHKPWVKSCCLLLAWCFLASISGLNPY